MKFKFKSILIAIAATAALGACSDSTAPGSPASGAVSASPSGAMTPSVAHIEASTKGFSAGSLMSAQTFYVFFDAQCSHCGFLWEAFKPLQSQARVVWIPVGILNAASTSQGATLLDAPDPVAAMNEHEKSLTARTGGISAGDSSADTRGIVGKNTEVLKSFGVQSIPYIFGTNAKTGETVTVTGSLPTQALAERLGLEVPAPSTDAPAATPE
jgi:thiol:disulfide interchange protein DsbG